MEALGGLITRRASETRIRLPEASPRLSWSSLDVSGGSAGRSWGSRRMQKP